MFTLLLARASTSRALLSTRHARPPLRWRKYSTIPSTSAAEPARAGDTPESTLAAAAAALDAISGAAEAEGEGSVTPGDTATNTHAAAEDTPIDAVTTTELSSTGTPDVVADAATPAPDAPTPTPDAPTPDTSIPSPRLSPRPRDSRSKPTPRQLDLARRLVEHSAPGAEKLHKNVTAEQLSAWITKALETTPIPPTPSQLAAVRHMIEAGAPNADQVHEKMTYQEISNWINQSKVYGNYVPPKKIPSGNSRFRPATATQLELARRLSASMGLTAPYPEATATKGDVSDFISYCRAELLKQGKPLFLPREEERDFPATDRQRLKLERMEVVLGPDATRGEASDRISEIQKEMGVTWGIPEAGNNIPPAAAAAG
ncbi:hypothetical protein CALVIDRAFT_564740 [Calocera viscosa TUFC12733]|uniref:Uncharacterized protein n=1 Tax=Calocera viscosa (strain TUFC12733) TaxID=1330018 RepID=A0A167L4M1_CALVF|nr:hypothetical protein CALVIDRAFT_564740 [Calocera viscosa TUFC12733]